MRSYLVSLLVPAALAASPGCKSVECGDGTIEREGACAPADEIVGGAKCGEFTTLVGDTCTPVNPPTACGPGTVREVDQATGLGVCKPDGGGGGCGAPITCPPPDAGKQTICGQIYDLGTREPFQDASAQGTRCAAGATSGPCSLMIRAFDAIAFGMNPGAATPLAVDDTYIDNCGRYRLTNITVPAGPFIGLGLDDAAMAMAGPAGTTNTIGTATLKVPGTATQGLDGFVAAKATTDAWTASGGPPLSGGIYALLFRARSTGAALAPGVTVTRQGSAIPASDHYFTGCSALESSVDAAATATGGNGLGLVTGAAVTEGVVYSGSAALPAGCRYSAHAGAALPFILFVQVARPTNIAGMTCPL